MEIDHATMISTANTNFDAPDVPKLDGVSSMDDFMNTYESDHAAKKAAKSTNATQNKAAGSKAKTITPTPKLGPVAIGERSSKSTIALNEKYQALGIPQPSFTYEGGSDRGWHGQVSFPGLDADEMQGIKDDTIYSSKQEAKEGLSERALAILTRLEEEGSIKKMSAEARARSSKYRVALNVKHQKLGIPQPLFTYTGSTDLGWVAEISFSGLAAEDLPVQNLKNDAPFPNKLEAKEALSKQALELVEAAEKEGKFDKFNKSRGPAQQQPHEKKDPGPNYLGQLLGMYLPTKKPYLTSKANLLTPQNSDAPPEPLSPHTPTTASEQASSRAKSQSTTPTAHLPLSSAPSTQPARPKKPLVKPPPTKLSNTSKPRGHGPTNRATSEASRRRNRKKTRQVMARNSFHRQQLHHLLLPMLTNPSLRHRHPHPTPKPSPASPSCSPWVPPNGATPRTPKCPTSTAQPASSAQAATCMAVRLVRCAICLARKGRRMSVRD
jgi:hypothetical protein